MSPVETRDRVRDTESRDQLDRLTQKDNQAIRNIATYQAPGILAMLRGRSANIIATGDLPGHSQVCQYINERGQLAWAEEEDFVVVDPRFRPPSTDAVLDTAREVARLVK